MLLGYNRYREGHNNNICHSMKVWLLASWRHAMVLLSIMAALYSIVGSPLYYYRYDYAEQYYAGTSTSRNQAAVPLLSPPRSSSSKVDTTTQQEPSSFYKHNNHLDTTIPVSTGSRTDFSFSHHNTGRHKNSSSPPWVVFYNIYIPPDSDKGRTIAMNIIKEQIKQVSKSYAATALQQRGMISHDNDRDNNRLTIYYNTIGGKLDIFWMTNYCQRKGLTCHWMQRHYETGHEMVTLDRVHEFCQQQASHYHQDDKMIVIYIHTKGSFHHQGSGPGFHGQDYWRRHMTAASVSEPCLTNLQSHDNGINNSSTSTPSCNACGMLFQPFPAEHFAGNSWAAKCSYVKDLLPSSLLVPKRAHISESTTLQKAGLAHDLFPWAPPYLGTDRYLGEHWVGTLAPRLVPCDLSRHVSLGYWLNEERDTSQEFESPSSFAMAPRFKWNNSGWAYQAAVQDTKIVTNTARRQREFFLLPGRLFKWWMEYNVTPPNDSWIWDWYPDGQYWKQQLLRHGPNKTIADILLAQKAAGALDAAVAKKKKQGLVTTSSTNHQQNLIQSNLPHNVLALNLTTSPPFAIFYNIFLAPGGEKARQVGQDIVKEQLEQIAKSDAIAGMARTRKQPTLYYNTIGERLGAEFIDKICKVQKCHHMNHYEKGNEDKTLNRVQQFCVRNPTASVIYVHNKGSFHLQDSGPGFEGQDRWRRHMTDAVLGKDCLESMASNSTCNACGLLFQPLPAPHFPGNMFAAKCSYIQKLHVSWKFAPLRRQSLNAAKSAGLLFNYFPNHEAYVGKGRYLSEHWVGTNPAFVPCDVSQQVNLGYWLWGDRSKSEFSLSMAPHFNFTDNWAFQAAVKNKDKVLSNPETRRKEFFLLGGLLHRWIHEYDSLPASDSWVWSWFVDGSFWKSAVQKFGKKAVKEALRGENLRPFPVP